MNDLISRSELLKSINEEAKKIPIDAEKYHIDTKVTDGMNATLKAITNIVKEQPTAYDTDKVIEELEENASRYTKKYVTPYGNNGYKDTKAISIHKAIEIVKQGVIPDDVCEWRIVDRPNNLPIYNTSCGKIRLQCATGVDIYCNGCGKKIKVIGGGVND